MARNAPTGMPAAGKEMHVARSRGNPAGRDGSSPSPSASTAHRIARLARSGEKQSISRDRAMLLRPGITEGRPTSAQIELKEMHVARSRGNPAARRDVRCAQDRAPGPDPSKSKASARPYCC